MQKTAKKLIVAILIAASLTTAPINTNAAENPTPITVAIDGAVIAFDQPPVIESGRVLVPMRAIFEALGAEVRWIPESREIEAIKVTDEYTLHCSVFIEEKLLYVRCRETRGVGNEQILWFYSSFDVPPLITNGRTLVPARAVSEAFGAEVTWDSNSGIVHISTEKATFIHPDSGVEIALYSSGGNLSDKSEEEPQSHNKYNEPFNLKEGDTAGNVVKDPNNYDNNNSDTFTDAYRIGSIGKCTWYANGRFYEINNIRIPFNMGNAKNYIKNGVNEKELLIITDIANIQDKSIAVYEHISDSDHPGHVVFIEYIERDDYGNPINVYYSEANGAYDLNVGAYDYGYDGIIMKKTFSEFGDVHLMKLVGYVCPK